MVAIAGNLKSEDVYFYGITIRNPISEAKNLIIDYYEGLFTYDVIIKRGGGGGGLQMMTIDNDYW